MVLGKLPVPGHPTNLDNSVKPVLKGHPREARKLAA